MTDTALQARSRASGGSQGKRQIVMDRAFQSATAFFALLVLVVVANAVVIWVKGIRAGGLPTTEVPKQPSRLVEPSDFFATPEEKEAVRRWEAERDLAGSGTGGSER